MKKSGVLVAVLLLAGLAGQAWAALDDFYYTNDEIRDEIQALVDQYPDWIRLDSIGHSYELQAPIWSAKISDNVSVNEDEPALWVNGACHSEEILGINVTMGFIETLVTLGSAGHPDWAPIIQSMEIFCVPSNNPDGMSIVMSELDRTYRKNLHSLHPDGRCQIQVGIGNDSCGVDLNRNYPAWFEHGDGLWAQNSDAEQYDYFRGPYPFSEPECACIGEQTERERFVAAVAYHSARTSTNHEIIIHPWEWVEPGSGRTCPPQDYDMMQDLTRNMGDQIAGFNYEFYRNLAGKGHKGNHHNWIYSYYGAVGLLVEVGTQGEVGMQPENQEDIDFIVEENIDGLNWLCRRIIGYEVAAPGLVIHVRDSETEAPLEARLRIEEVMHPDCTPWYRTDPDFGAYYRLLKANPYSVSLRKHGYAARDEQVNVGAGLPTLRTWDLSPLPRYQVNLDFEGLEAPGTPISVTRLELEDTLSDTLLVWEDLTSFDSTLPEGVYELRAWSTDRVTAHHTLVLEADLDLSIQLASNDGDENPVFSRSFDSLDDFSQEGDGCTWALMENDSMGLHFEDTAERFSADDVNCRLACAETFTLDAPVRDVTPGNLSFVEFHRTEGLRDTVFVEFSRDGGGSWETVDFWTGHSHRIRSRSYKLGTDYSGAEFRFAFRMKTDDAITDEGLHVGDIVLSWNGNAVSLGETPALKPGTFSLQAAPNPFNPNTRVTLNLPEGMEHAKTRAVLYDIMGRRLREIPALSLTTSATREYQVQGDHLASGVYLLQVSVSHGSELVWMNTRRLTLLK